MKIFSIMLLLSVKIFALEIVIEDPCHKMAFVDTQVSITDKISVGAITVKLLNQNQVSFEGSESGIISIMNSPKSLEALEVLDDNSLRSHGWCYTIDGKLSNLLSNEQMISSKYKNLRWYYGYYLMDQGVWGSDCLPVEKSFLETFCINAQ